MKVFKINHCKYTVISLILLCLTIGLFACTAPTALPKPSPSETPTTATLTLLPMPTATLTQLPTATPFAGLAAPRPWLMLKQDDDQPLLVYPPDRNPFLISLPSRGQIRSIQEAVSPDGKWIAFFTGSHKGPNPNLTLNLLSLANGSVRTITQVLTKGFPQNMRPVAEYMDQTTPDDPNGISLSVDGWMQLLENIFPQAVMAVAWSPDSRSLAFSAQIDGPSADVYVYSLDTGKTHQMVDDIYISYSIQWSPDGKWILYSNNIPGPNYSARTLSILRADGPMVHNPTYYQNSLGWFGERWLTDNQYLIYHHGDGGDAYQLQVLRVDTRTITDIWPGTYFSYAYDPDHQVFLVCGYSKPKSAAEQPQIDLYTIQLNGQKSVTGKTCFASADFVGWKTNRFIGRGPEGVIAIDMNGNMVPLYQQTYGLISISPDRKWAAVYNNEEIEFIQEPGKLIQSIRLTGISTVLWSPDSAGLWIGADQFYFFSIPDSKLSKIRCPFKSCWIAEDNALWLP